MTLTYIGTLGISGLNWISNFLAADNCLDYGVLWNYETESCEFQTTELKVQQQNLEGTVWISKSIVDGYDSLIFKSDSEVTYFLNELSWDFRSTYEITGDILTVLTKTFEIDVDDTSKLNPNLKEQYKITEDSLKLIYLANLINGSWQETSADRIGQLNKYERIK